MPQLPSALFNYHLYCHIDIEKGLDHAMANPFCFVVGGYLYADIFSTTRR